MVARMAARIAVALTIGGAIGAMARVARAASVAHPNVPNARHTPTAPPSTALPPMDLAHVWTRLVASLDGTGPVFAQLALIATGAIAVAAGARALLLWRAARLPARPAPMAPTFAPNRAPNRAPNASPDDGADTLPTARRRFALPALPFRVPSRSLPRPQASRSSRRTTPASVRALADAGTSRAEIARRTGLSRDAVGLAMSL
jgi:hypothetical protein